LNHGAPFGFIGDVRDPPPISPRFQRVDEQAERLLALADDDDVDEGMLRRLRGRQRRMIAAPNDRQVGGGLADEARGLESVADLGARHGGDAHAQRFGT
jgi:hypothetical protein